MFVDSSFSSLAEPCEDSSGSRASKMRFSVVLDGARVYYREESLCVADML